VDEPAEGTSPEMIATLINYLNWRAEKTKKRGR